MNPSYSVDAFCCVARTFLLEWVSHITRKCSGCQHARLVASGLSSIASVHRGGKIASPIYLTSVPCHTIAMEPLPLIYFSGGNGIDIAFQRNDFLLQRLTGLAALQSGVTSMLVRGRLPSTAGLSPPEAVQNSKRCIPSGLPTSGGVTNRVRNNFNAAEHHRRLQAWAFRGGCSTRQAELAPDGRWGSGIRHAALEHLHGKTGSPP